MAMKKNVPRLVAPDDLDQVVREVTRDASGLSTAVVKKRLPLPYQRFTKPIALALDALVEKGELVAFKKSKTTSIYFTRHPLDRLDVLAREQLSEPVTKAELKSWVSEAAPGYGVVFDDWLKRARDREVLFVHGLPRAKDQRFSPKPEPEHQVLLHPVLKALRAALSKTDKKRIPRQRLAEVLLAELGLSAPHANGATTDGRSDFLAALDRLAAEDPSSALLPVRALRRRLSLGKREFDDLALRLAREGVVSLHYHDFAASLPESERNELIVDARGTHYVGIAPRGRR
jgi:hypothetical protein